MDRFDRAADQLEKNSTGDVYHPESNDWITMTRIAIVCVMLMGFAAATPAIAATGNAIAVPEPTDVLLFVMGVAGVAIGRRMHARSARRDREKDDVAED